MKRKRTLYRVHIAIKQQNLVEALRSRLTYRTYTPEEAGEKALKLLEPLAAPGRTISVDRVEAVT